MSMLIPINACEEAGNGAAKKTHAEVALRASISSLFENKNGSQHYLSLCRKCRIRAIRSIPNYSDSGSLGCAKIEFRLDKCPVTSGHVPEGRSHNQRALVRDNMGARVRHRQIEGERTQNF